MKIRNRASTLLTTIAICFSLFTANAQPANAQPANRFTAYISISEKDPQKVIIIVNNPSAEKISIEVYSSEYEYLFTKTISTPTYQAAFDFSTAVDGDYIVKIYCGKEKQEKRFSFRTREVMLRELQVD